MVVVAPVTPIRRVLQEHRLRIDWLAQQTGITRRRMYRLAIGYARWTTKEANAATSALAPYIGQSHEDTYRALFAGVEVRPDPHEDVA